MAQRLAARRPIVPSQVQWARALASAALLLLLFTMSPARAQTNTEGEELFNEFCSTCHGSEGRGGELGRPLSDAGAAGADFQLRTGRMPLGDSEQQAERKESPFTENEIDALVEYVESFGDGPEIPEVALAGARPAAGQELYSENCAPCHGTTATGGAVGPGALAPSLFVADDVEIAEAMITGPGEMPVFDFADHERNEIVAFVLHLQDEKDPGGQDIGGIGPVPEGFVAWLLGGAGVVALCLFIGVTRKQEGEQ